MRRLILLFSLLVCAFSAQTQTTVYQEFYDAYDADHAIIDNVNWTAKMVHESYTPNASNTPSDVKKFIVSSGGSLQGTEFKSNSMGSIIEIMQGRLRTEIKSEPSDAIQKVSEIDGLSEEEKNALIEVINQVSDDSLDDGQWWESIKEAGIKYIVVESPNLKILCFCEEL